MFLIISGKLLGGGLAGFVDPLAFENLPDGARQDLHVQPQRPVIDVPHVQVKFILPRERVAPVDFILTAKGDDVDRIVGLELGADDYLAKPFNPRELVARINAVLRRRRPIVPGAPLQADGPITFGPCALDLAARMLTRDGQPIQLTTGEFALLKALVDHPHQPLSREKLMELARGRDLEPFDRTIDVQVSRLRKLIEENPSAPRFIQTVWGFGYVFVPDGVRP